MESRGKGGGVGLRVTEIETAADGLGRSEIFHIVKEILGFVLYMHHQIPSILQHLENEYDTLKEEHKSLEETVLKPIESKPSFQRKHNLRKREVKQGIKRLEKLMNSISSLLSALQGALDEMPNIQGVTMVLGASPLRPQHVYQMLFFHGKFDYGSAKDSTKSKVAEALSRKAIRALISSGAGSSSYAGPSKLFLLVKSTSTFNLPLHFLPKRDFHYSKKIAPFNLNIKCKIPDRVINDSQHTSKVASSSCLSDSTLNDVIWFQCRHIIKGLASKTPIEC
ncbi:uncharacterized protein [Elaeis guineensis]|uniref:Uncharacterized protein LOC105059935 isoform X2 n=1 Tax=Elaeis guineensis var. tenera TaxID=51953 RepID=A0A6I9SEP8_ELAGV|nr:uncharacterized protein LOC105059935 isoform X2 [Elaeis guineensis]